MEIEDRYVVLKISSLMSLVLALKHTWKDAYVSDCLVIENDWPEYGPTLAMLSERVDSENTQV